MDVTRAQSRGDCDNLEVEEDFPRVLESGSQPRAEITLRIDRILMKARGTRGMCSARPQALLESWKKEVRYLCQEKRMEYFKKTCVIYSQCILTLNLKNVVSLLGFSLSLFDLAN